MARNNKKSNFNRDIIGIALFTLGILMVLSIFSQNSFGIMGRFIKTVLLGLFGLGAYILPFYIIFIGICFIIKKKKLSFNKKFYGFILLFLSFLLTIQMINMKFYYIPGNLLLGIENIFKTKSIMHGGMLCLLIDIPLYKLFGSIGCYIIFFAIFLISLILILQFSLYNVLNNIKTIFNNFNFFNNNNNDNDLIDENSLIKQEIAVSNGEKNNYIKNINNKIKIIDFLKSSVDGDSKQTTNEVHSLKGDTPKEFVTEEFEKEIKENSSVKTVDYKVPPMDLLNPNSLLKLNKEDKRDLINSANKLEETLSSFGVEAKVNQVTKGPSVTRFELQPNAGVKVSKIVNLADDIALNLAAPGVRIEAPIPGKAAVGIEVPNKELTPVYLREVIESLEFINSNKSLSVSLGKDISGNCVVTDLTKMPHLLIAGATGSGKSVCINTLIISLLYKYSPEDVKLLLIDPKVVELSVYNGIPHLLIPVVTDAKKAAGALNWAVNEMTRRYKAFAENAVRNIEGYNELVSKGKLTEKLPKIVIIVDELADLMMVCANDVEDYIGRLAQMARAAGMHLVIATQRPSVDVITGVIKANIPSRMSFAVSSQIDSRTILDMAGAEKLLGKGDMLFYPTGQPKPLRIQGAFISEEEVEKVVLFIKEQECRSEYKTEILQEMEKKSSTDEVNTDELLEEAIKIIIETGQASTSLIQRKLRIGYNRAARIIEQMEQKGIISHKDGSRPRQILVHNKDN